MKLIRRSRKWLGRVIEGRPPHPRRVNKEYLDWITYAVAGMTEPGNFYCFDYVMSRLPGDEPILEIGTWCGRSAIALSYFLDVHHCPNRLITCDEWEYERFTSNPNVGDTQLTHRRLKSFLKESYIRNVKTFTPHRLPHTIECNASHFFAEWQNDRNVLDVFGQSTQLGGGLSFCFIDGNHTYEAARQDFENCDRFLRPGGFILFDDSADGSDWEVCRVVREVVAGGRYSLVMKNPNYLFRKL